MKPKGFLDFDLSGRYISLRLVLHVKAIPIETLHFCFPWPKGHLFFSLFTQSHRQPFIVSWLCYMCFPKLDEWRSGFSLSIVHRAAKLLKNILSSPSVTLHRLRLLFIAFGGILFIAFGYSSSLNVGTSCHFTSVLWEAAIFFVFNFAKLTASCLQLDT